MTDDACELVVSRGGLGFRHWGKRRIQTRTQLQAGQPSHLLLVSSYRNSCVGDSKSRVSES
jgi:hypothetical protein